MFGVHGCGYVFGILFGILFDILLGILIMSLDQRERDRKCVPRRKSGPQAQSIVSRPRFDGVYCAEM